MRQDNLSSRPARSSSQAVRPGRHPLRAVRIPEPDPQPEYGLGPGWSSPGNPEEVAHPFRNTPRLLAICERLCPCTTLLMDQATIKIGGSLRKGVLDFLGQ